MYIYLSQYERSLYLDSDLFLEQTYIYIFPYHIFLRSHLLTILSLSLFLSHSLTISDYLFLFRNLIFSLFFSVFISISILFCLYLFLWYMNNYLLSVPKFTANLYWICCSEHETCETCMIRLKECKIMS